jgi:Luciferase-like monooxygenase
MNLGLTLAQLGPFAEPTAVATMARDAEARGYDALWVIDRLLDPLHPRAAYPASADGALPEEQRIALDPIVTLATAAAHTSTIRIGTNVLVAPWYRPVLLARSLASLDVVSRGRLDIGLGLGWSADEYDAVGVSQRGLAARQEELLDLLDAIWAPDPVHYSGTASRWRHPGSVPNPSRPRDPPCSWPPTRHPASSEPCGEPTAGHHQAFRLTPPPQCGPSSPRRRSRPDAIRRACPSLFGRTSNTPTIRFLVIGRRTTATSSRSPATSTAPSPSARDR